MPELSIIVPVHNCEKYIEKCINSILNQTFKDFEFIILNDCSTDDNVEKVVLEYAKNDKRIFYYKNEKNLGISESRNKLIELSKGEYLAVMDHDDISLPNRFEKEVEFLDKNKDIGVVSSWFKTVSGKSIIKQPIDNLDIKVSLMRSCVILHPASMIRKSVLIDNKIKYEEMFTPAEDYALWCRLIQFTKFANIPEVLFKYRVHSNNTSKKQRAKMILATSLVYKLINKKYNDEFFILSERVKYIKLFSIIPLLKIQKKAGIIKYKLFNLIPILLIRDKGE